jgi:cytochrome c553
MRAFLLATLCVGGAASAASPSWREFHAVIAARPDPARGQELFTRCLRCHGLTADGTPDGAVPRLAGQHFQVLVRQIIQFRYGRRWNDSMADVTMDLHVLENAQDIADIAAYLNHLEPGPPLAAGDESAPPRLASLYAARCAACHGRSAEGDDAGWVPRLAGQHAAYLERQMLEAARGRRPEMERPHRKFFDHMPPDDVRGLGEFLERIERPPPPEGLAPRDSHKHR